MLSLNTLRGFAQRRVAKVESAPTAEQGLLLGDAATDLLPEACPACGRPLERSFGRCPGCGTPLVMGVQAQRAGAFVLIGLGVGLLIGIVLAAAIGQRTVYVVAEGPAPARPAATTAATPYASTVPTIPPASTSALSQSAVINRRLVASLADLEAGLSLEPFDSVSAAQALRSMAADAAIGVELAPRLDRWADAQDLAAQLADFYTAVRAKAHEGLDSAFANVDAYHAAAVGMVKLFGRLDVIDAASRTLAGTAGVTLAKVDLPATPAPTPTH